MLKLASLGNFKWAFYGPPYLFFSFWHWNNLKTGGGKSPRKPLSSNGNDFIGYLNSTFKPDLNTKNKKAMCQMNESKIKCEFVQCQMEGFEGTFLR